MTAPQQLVSSNGSRIAYHQTPGRSPGVIFLTGFKSDMEGAKALALEAHLKRRGNAFLRFDYTGHGRSSGEFEQGSLKSWSGDALEVLDQLTQGPQVLVGSSMGGWIMLLTAVNRPQRIAGLLGVAAAPDFTEDLWQRLTKAQRAALHTHGKLSLPSCYGDDPYVITEKLLNDSRSCLLLDRPLPITAPVRLIHGMQDQDVPWQTSLRITDQLTSSDVETLFVKNGDHRLSSDEDLQRLCRVLDTLLDQLETTQSA